MKTEAFYVGKKVLVTGGAGFIGSHLVERLVKLGAKVTVLDNLSSGNINNLKNVFPQINLIYGDIINSFTALNATKRQDIVFHLAALISVAYSTEHPQTCYKINIDGTHNILEGCKKNGVGTFIFSSSAAVYGNRDTTCHDTACHDTACKETDTPNPQSPYATSKFESENLCKQYAIEHNINTASLRYFNVYGDRQNPNGDYAAVVAKFTHNLKNRLPIIIFGDGKQTRDFINVSHVVDANLNIALHSISMHSNAMHRDAVHTQLSGDIFNVASGKSINLMELIKQLEDELGVKHVEIVFKDRRAGDIIHSLASCDRYNKFVG